MIFALITIEKPINDVISNNKRIITKQNFEKTTVTTPITTKVYRTRFHVETTYRDHRDTTSTYTQKKVTYKDGTTEIIKGVPEVVVGECRKYKQALENGQRMFYNLKLLPTMK